MTPNPNHTNAPNNAITTLNSHSGQVKRERLLAAELDAARTELDRPLPATALPGDPDAGTGSGFTASFTASAAALERRRAAARRWDELLTRVRELAGFEDFLRPVRYARLRVAAAGGPVVMVNASILGCQAMILEDPSDARPRVVNLPTLSHADAVRHAKAMRGMAIRATDRHRDRAVQRDLEPVAPEEVRDRAALFDVLEWLWDTVADPVLHALGHTAAPEPGQPWPRVWWCPTGPLALLPVHAAGHYPTGRRRGRRAPDSCVPDRVVSSYTPTLTALTRAREREHRHQPVRQLAVGMPDTPGHPRCPR